MKNNHKHHNSKNNEKMEEINLMSHGTNENYLSKKANHF